MARKRGKTKADSSRRRRAATAKTMENLRHFVRTEGERFLQDPNITSVGVGYKVKDGKRSKKLCLQFTVASKAEDLGTVPEGVETHLIPPVIEVAGESIPTDVLERAYAPSYQLMTLQDVEDIAERKLRLDPLVPGISVSHPSGRAGTLGMVVFDRGTGDPCMLSNWHVLHRADGLLGDTVVQPGPFDDNRVDGNSAGTLLRSHLGPAGDCAIARIEDRDYETEILELGVTPSRVARVELGDPVVKSGRTTGVTRGVVRRVEVMAELAYPGVGSRNIGGFEIEPHEGESSDVEISEPGDSGSVWMVAAKDGTATDILAGLHFAGEGRENPDEHALACYAHSVFRKLRITLNRSVEPEDVADGYDSEFLSQTVPTPRLSQEILEDAFLVDESPLIPYTHFSVCQSKERRLARFVAWNIDGGRLKRLSRKGIRFRRDRRVPDEFQAGNELYRDNALDRGHVARRADLTWGSMREAQKANRDSFYFTNISPQHEAFNQSGLGGLWGELENAILEDVRVEDSKISAMAGPVFRPDDPVYREVRIPREYWKLLAYRDDDDEQFKVRAFLLTQRDLLTELEALELDEFRLFEVSLRRLRTETGLSFSALNRYEPEGLQPEAVAAGAREIRDRKDVAR